MLISNSLNIPANGRYDHYGIGYYTEPETQRLYFYASYYSDRIDSKKWKIYRVAVDQVPLVWEFVGDMNIVMNNVCISPCGRHLWSLEIDWLPRRVEQSRVFFRQVNIRTLEFEDFKTPVLPFNEVTNDMRSAHYQHTIHGTFLFVHVYQENFEMHKVIDEIFLMGIDQVKRQVHFKLIELPKLPTGDFYHVNERFYNNVHGKWSTGIIELYDSLYFYRIDYFGSLYVLNWQPSGPSDWTKFSVTGDYRPATLIKSDKQDLDAAAEGFTPEWINCINHLTNSRRFYLQNGIVHEDIYETKSSVFYQLKFQIENLTCECSEILRIRRNNCTVFHTYQRDGSHVLMCNRLNQINWRTERLAWELVGVGQVPKLKYLAYWTVRNHLRSTTRNRWTRALISIVDRLITTIRVKRRKPVKENPNWPEKRSGLVANPKEIVMRVSRLQILYLLKKLTKK